jgi:hypothetical protein
MSETREQQLERSLKRLLVFVEMMIKEIDLDVQACTLSITANGEAGSRTLAELQLEALLKECRDLVDAPVIWRPGEDDAGAALGPFRATHQHRKGGMYQVIAQAEREADLALMVVYRDRLGRTWVRPRHEFFDGRFTPVEMDGRGS